jgi:hypothetical protein
MHNLPLCNTTASHILWIFPQYIWFCTVAWGRKWRRAVTQSSLHTQSHELVSAYLGVDKSLARPISRSILFYGENISFDASFVIYINSNNNPPIMIINRINEHQNLLSL